MEKQFVQWLSEKYRVAGKNIPVGLGDDAAVLKLPDSQIVVSTDSIADGTHFESQKHTLEEIGHKALAVSLSDIAAMGARPVFATVNFTCPAAFELSDVQRLFDAIWQTGQKFDVPIVGGDTNRWDGNLVVSSTVVGAAVAGSGGDFWTMSRGNPGDQILVSGALGGSILRKHIGFTPRVEVAAKLASKFSVTAATDITDSLALDLAALATQSGCGFRIVRESLPASEDAHELAQTSKQSPGYHALYDGEDFELILCAESSVAEKILADTELNVRLTRIGELTEEKRFLIMEKEGAEFVPLEIKGFEH